MVTTHCDRGLQNWVPCRYSVAKHPPPADSSAALALAVRSRARLDHQWSWNVLAGAQAASAVHKHM